MGLDMWIFKGKHNPEEILYWRKEPAIHDWFEQLAILKGIQFDSFNCIKVPLTKQNILDLINAISEGNLNFQRQGFFFGSNSDDNNDEWKQYQIDQLNSILPHFKDRRKIYYDSWW